MKFFGKKRGFTFVETILAIIIVGAIAGVAAKVLIAGLDVYALVVNRHDASQTARLAMERMVDEIVTVEWTDITGMYNTRFSFRDIDGHGTNFKTRIVSKGGQSVNCIYRDEDFLGGSVSSFDFDYFDANGNSTIWSWQVRRINIEFNIDAPANAGVVHLRTDVFPRNFMYDNFE